MSIEYLDNADADEKLENAISKLPKGKNIVLPSEQLPVPDISWIEKKYEISWLEYAWYWVKPKIADVVSIVAIFIPQVKAIESISKLITPKTNVEDFKMEDLKGFVISVVIRWIMKVGGGFLLSVGISQGSVVEIVTAIITVIIGMIISLVNHKTAVNMEPPR